MLSGSRWISEYLISDDELKWLTMANVSFLKSGVMRFVLYKTKNNSAGPFQEVLFPPTRVPGDVLCPVTAIRAYLELRPSTSSKSPFFLDLDGLPLEARVFNEVLRSVLTRMSIPNVELYTSKSFKIRCGKRCRVCFEYSSIGYSSVGQMAIRGFHVLCTERCSCYSCGLGSGPFGSGEGVFLASGAFGLVF